MPTMVSDLYAALKAAGINDELARKAAEAVIAAEDKDELVTKDFLHAEVAKLRADMSEMKTDILKWNVGTMVAMTGIFAAIVKFL